jgi:hypothetical protein
LDRIGAVLFWTGYYLEKSFVIAIEGIKRFVYGLNPRVYFECLRIRRVVAGRDAKPTRKYVILVLYCPSALPEFTKVLVESIGRTQLNLVIVSNTALEIATEEYLLDRCRWLIDRRNVGRDFGGYKDGISVVTRQDPGAARLILANDSVFYLESGLDALLAKLDGEGDFIGVSEVTDHHYHLGSFLISFGPSVLTSPQFQRYWRRYLPIGTRRWAIFRGEGRLTAVIAQSGIRPKVLYRAEDLRSYLRPKSISEFMALVGLLPTFSRAERREWIKQIASQLTDAPAATVESLGAIIADEIVGAIHQRNQMHTGGFLFRHFMGLPIIKRDIVFREVYPIEEVSRFLEDLDRQALEEILVDLRRRGSAASLGVLQRVFYRHSAV